MDSAKYRDVVGQRKMYSAATAKENISKVIPELCWWHQKVREISKTTLIRSMVVFMLKSNNGSPGWIPQRSQINSPFLPTKLAFKNDGGGRSRSCVEVTSADSCRMREIEADCSRLKPWVQGEHLTNQPSWEAVWLLVTCGSPVYLVVNDLRPCVVWSLMIWLGGSVEVFLTWWLWFYL